MVVHLCLNCVWHAGLFPFLLCVKAGFTPTCTAPTGAKLLFTTENRCKGARFCQWQTQGQANIKEKHLSLQSLPFSLQKASEHPPPMPVPAGVRPGLRDGTEWMMRWGIQAPAWSSSGSRVEEEAPAGPGGDPTGALILSTVAKGLVVSGIIHRRGRFR